MTSKRKKAWIKLVLSGRDKRDILNASNTYLQELTPEATAEFGKMVMGGQSLYGIVRPQLPEVVAKWIETNVGENS